MEKTRKFFRMRAVALVLSMLLASSLLVPTNPVGAEDGSSIPSFTQQPYASFFFSKDFIAWSEKTDPDAINNVSSVPLAKRVTGKPVNGMQSTQAKLMSLAIANQHTSGTASQGSEERAIYDFTNWQYVDTLVAWAGSAGEGIIVPPSGDMTDLAHRNGVPILGTIFFPPPAYGGKSAWVDEFVQQKADGSFPAADQMIHMARYYGFDGWFINAETPCSEATAQKLQKLMVYFQEHKSPKMQLIWYDSLIPDGSVNWKNTLDNDNSGFFQEKTRKISDGMFLNFGWDHQTVVSSAALAGTLKRSPYDLYAGIDVQGSGTEAEHTPSEIFDAAGKSLLSLGLYCPDWTLRDGTNGLSGDARMSKYWENERDFWINQNGDPRKTDTNGWGGISSRFVEKSPLTSLPFYTTFNVGTGKNFYIDGSIAKPGTFNNRSIQDVMPTYRWILDNKGNHLSNPVIDENDAWYAGSCLRLDGSVTKGGSSTLRLYYSNLPLTKHSQADLRFKGPVCVRPDLKLTFTDGSAATVIGTPEGAAVNQWERTHFDLSGQAGKTVETISFVLNGKEENADTSIYLGEFLISNQTDETLTAPANAQILGRDEHDGVTVDLRLAWDASQGPVRSYNLYLKDGAGNYAYQGSTSNTAYCVRNLKRPTSSELQLVLFPVDQDGMEHRDLAASLTYDFLPLPKPTIDFSADKTIAKVGEKVTLTALASAATESVAWFVPGATPEHATGRTAEFSFAKPGVYSVSITAVNSSGESTAEKSNFIIVYEDGHGPAISNLALNPGVSEEVSGCTNERENGAKAHDGDTKTKWCDNSHDHPWIVLDLKKPYMLERFKIYHAGVREDPQWNARDFEILLSVDGKTWKQALHVSSNTQTITDNAIQVTEARYVKLYYNLAEQNGRTARLYEFGIYGYDKSQFTPGTAPTASTAATTTTPPTAAPTAAPTTAPATTVSGSQKPLVTGGHGQVTSASGKTSNQTPIPKTGEATQAPEYAALALILTGTLVFIRRTTRKNSRK